MNMNLTASLLWQSFLTILHLRFPDKLCDYRELAMKKNNA